MGNPRIDELRGRLERDPASRLFAQLAEELRKDGALVDAIGVCRDGLARHPTYTSARLTLGRCLLETRDARGAVLELKTVVAGAPDNILAVRLLAEAQELAGDLRAAADNYEATLRLAPSDKQVAGRLEAVQARLKAASPAAGPPPAPPPPPQVDDPFAPIPLSIVDPEESFELEGAGGVPLGGPPPLSPPAAPVAPVMPEAPIEEDPDPAPETIRIKRARAPANYDDSPAAALEAAFAAEMEHVPTPVGSTQPAAPSAELASVTLAELYRSQGALEKAIDTCAEVLRREPDNVRAHAMIDELRVQAAAVAPAAGDRRAALEGAIARLEGLLAVLRRA